MKEQKNIKPSRTFMFEEMPVPQAVLNLTIPTVISSLVMVIYNLSDTYFVGLLNNPVQTAAVTLVAPVMLGFNAVNNLFGVGCSSMMSRALGSKRFAFAQSISAFGFYCTLAAALLFSFLCLTFREPLLTLLGADAATRAATDGYLQWTVICGAAPAILNVVFAYMVRSEGASLHASIGTMSGCLLNILLDPFFILPWGLNMGAAGAGLATFLSNCVALTYFLVLMYVRRRTTCVCLSPRRFQLKKDIILGVCSVGIPSSIQNLLNVTGMTLLNNLAAGYGASAVAAIGIAQKINMVPIQMAVGFSQGCMPIISYNYSSTNYKRMKASIDFAYHALIPVMVGVTVFYFVFSGSLIRLFINNDQIIQYGTWFLRGMCLVLPFLRTDFLAVGVFQALGNGRIPLVFAILRKLVLEIPALLILNALFPMYGLAYAQFFSELVLSAAAMVMLRRLYKRLGVR
ncbi:MAG: MATE family efflux transporter [Eubacteriales bacterium]|nr:MATE family efflux transporter [Eubacteriales bacterium]